MSGARLTQSNTCKQQPWIVLLHVAGYVRMLASIIAASLYFFTFLTIFMATYVLCFLSQHSKTLPKVPAVVSCEMI